MELDRLTAEEQHRQLRWRMVNALEATFNIPSGAHLVFVLGDGAERSNHAALNTWLGKQLLDMEQEAAEKLMPILCDRLYRLLAHWEQDRFD
jgi:hypothetical protein